MLARYVIYFYFLKNITASIGCYIDTCVHTSSRLLKLGSNFREICLARRVSTTRSHPYKQQVDTTVQRDVKEQKKSRKSRKDTKDDKRSKKRQVSPSPDVGSLHSKSVPVPVKPPVQAQVTSGPEVVPKQKLKPAPLSAVASDPEQSELFLPGTTGPVSAQPGPSGQVPPVVQTSSLFGDSTVTEAYRAPPEPDFLDIDPPQSEASYSEDQVSDEGEIS